MQIESIRRNNLQSIIDKSQKSRLAFCKLFNLHYGNISSMLEGKRPFTEKTARKIESLLNLQIGDLDRTSSIENPEIYFVPIYNIHLSAGHGCAISEEKPIAKYPILLEDIKANGWNSKALCIFKVKGDSMEPMILDKELVIVQTDDKEIVDNKVYAICIHDDVYIKRLFKDITNSKVTMRSDNKNYPDKEISLDKFTIIGRVVFLLGKKI